MKYLKTILCLLYISNILFGQIIAQTEIEGDDNQILLQELIEIQTDRELYVTGEALWFKITTIDKSLSLVSNYSRVAYLELIDPEGTIVTRVKTELNKGRSSGTIILPKDINSNLYSLRSYTRMMRNFDVSFFALKQVYILNSEQSLLADNSHSGSATFRNDGESKNKNQIAIGIEPSSQEVEQRELVEVKLKILPMSGIDASSDLSVSVSIPSFAVSDNHSAVQASDAVISESSDFFAPEVIGMNLSGELLNNKSNPSEAGIRIYLSFPGETALVYTALTDSMGRFEFLLPRLYGQRQVVLQLDPGIESEYSIRLDDDFHPSQTVDAQSFILPNELMPKANRTLTNSQIADSYISFETNAEYQINDKFLELPFYGKPDMVYKLDDYTRFPLPEFFYEVVPEVRVMGKFGDKTLLVVNDYDASQRELTPLLLVDGVPVFQQENFLSINNKLIVSSEIVSDPFWLNTILHNGIIQLSSIDGDARSFSLPASAIRTNFLTFLPQRKFSAPDYSSTLDNNLPDFRNTLYWNPSIKTDENGEASISFYTSDAIGEYEIKVEAINSGQMVKASKSIEVVKPIK